MINWLSILVHLTHCHTTLTTLYTSWQQCVHLDNTVYIGGMMNWFYILVHLTHIHTNWTTLHTPVVWRTDCIFWSTWDIGIAPWQPGIHRWCDEHILHSAPPDTLSYHLDNTVYTLTTLYTPVVSWTGPIWWSTWHIVIAPWQHSIHRWCD